MKTKIIVIFLSMIAAVFFMSGGYGFWEKDLNIKSMITVEEPEPEVSGGAGGSNGNTKKSEKISLENDENVDETGKKDSVSEQEDNSGKTENEQENSGNSNSSDDSKNDDESTDSSSEDYEYESEKSTGD